MHSWWSRWSARWARRGVLHCRVVADAATLSVEPCGPGGSVTLLIRGPLRVCVLEPDGVSTRTLAELRLHRMRFSGGEGVTQRLASWSVDTASLEVDLGCAMDHRGDVQPASLVGVIADRQGHDIVFGHADRLGTP